MISNIYSDTSYNFTLCCILWPWLKNHRFQVKQCNNLIGLPNLPFASIPIHATTHGIVVWVWRWSAADSCITITFFCNNCLRGRAGTSLIRNLPVIDIFVSVLLLYRPNTDMIGIYAFRICCLLYQKRYRDLVSACFYNKNPDYYITPLWGPRIELLFIF